MMTYCRTDLCPECGTRLKMSGGDIDINTILLLLDYPSLLPHKEELFYTINCDGCQRLWTKTQVHEYWAEYLMMDNKNEQNN